MGVRGESGSSNTASPSRQMGPGSTVHVGGSTGRGRLVQDQDFKNCGASRTTTSNLSRAGTSRLAVMLRNRRAMWMQRKTAMAS